MNENQNPSNTERRPAGNLPNVPPRTTTENFRLNLTEEQMASGSMRPVQERGMNAPQAQSYNRQAYTEQEKKQEAKAHRKRNKLKAGKNKRVFKLTWLAMVVLLGLTLGSYLIDGAYDFLAASRETETIVHLEIPEDVTIKQLSDILFENGVIKKKEFFDLYFQLTAKKDLQYITKGDHILKSNMDYQEIIDNLMSSDSSEVVELTFVEGVNALDIANQLETSGVCSADEFLKEINSAKYRDKNYPEIQALTDLNNRYYMLEGYLYPDTYYFYKNSQPDEVVSKFLETFPSRTELLKARVEESGYTLDQIIVMASIIQREAANTDDMYRVSAVLHNRLADGSGLPLLQCDSTIYYPYHTKADLPEGQGNYESTYNTYAIDGLPKGAICNPGISAIKAALMPSKEYADYLYFCHAADGTAYYARTGEEHEENEIAAGIK